MNTTNDKVELLLFKVQGVFQAQNLREAERCKGAKVVMDTICNKYQLITRQGGEGAED